MSKVEPWCKACGEGELPSELQDLEDTIHHHQGLYEHITTAYSEVSMYACTHTGAYVTNMNMKHEPLFNFIQMCKDTHTFLLVLTVFSPISLFSDVQHYTVHNNTTCFVMCETVHHLFVGKPGWKVSFGQTAAPSDTRKC